MRSAAGIACALLAIAYFVAQPSPSRGPLPAGVRALAARLEAHPADWLAASALAERALDAPVRDPLALWHASGLLAISLAPSVPEPRASFARAGFFHWTELSAADRKLVLDAYAPVLRDWLTFVNTYKAVFALTGDFGYLRRAQSGNDEATRYLAELAATNGLFADYRSLRAEMPGRVPTARRLDRRDVVAQREVAVTVAPEESDEVPAYVEVYVDDALRAEAIVAREQKLTAPVSAAGTHVVEIDLANPGTRNGALRRVRVVSVVGL